MSCLHRIRLVLVVAAVAAASHVERAAACPVCETGDTTLTMLGGERLYAGGWRAALMVTHAGSDSGGAGGRVVVGEWRVESGLSFDVSARFGVMLTVPVIARTLDFGASGDDVAGLGDPMLLARGVLFQDRPRAAHHVVSLDGGVRMPLAPTRRYASGTPMIPEQQLGSGAWTPTAGLAWDVASAPWSLHVAARGTWTSSARGGDRASRTLSFNALGARRFGAFALRAGLELRVDGRALDHGVVDRDSGGAILFAGGDALVAPLDVLTVLVGLRVPIADALDGRHDEDPIVSAGLTWDFD